MVKKIMIGRWSVNGKISLEGIGDFLGVENENMTDKKFASERTSLEEIDN